MKQLFFTLSLFFLVCTGLQSQESITLQVGRPSAKVGETVCVPITVADFSGILSTQYTVQWDARYLEFVSVDNFGLPWLSPSNFGTQKTQEGLLTVVWIDNALRGITRTDGQPIYEICFKVKAGRGQEAYIGFTESPTPFEVVNQSEQVIMLNALPGGVQIQ